VIVYPWYASSTRSQSSKASTDHSLIPADLIVKMWAQPRDLVAFPNGANASDVLIDGMHFNRTTLNYWNYTLWSNGTLSNGSKCYLAFQPYTPIMFSNGSFHNQTDCSSPIEGIEGRAILGIVASVLFALSIMFSLINLRKHGRHFLPAEKRFRAVGRRWQWYWMVVVGTVGCLSGIFAIDVDRDYIQGTSLILQSAFYNIMEPVMLALVWEAVRHW
jgi:Protein of unknown function (DUF2434)